MNHLQLHEENCKSKHVLAYISSLFPLCPIHLYSEKLICGRWLGQDLREFLHSSLGAAFCTGGSKTKYEDVKGLWRRIRCWGCFDAQWKSQTWYEPCCNLLDWYNQTHPLPISSRGVSHIHTSRQVLHMLQGLQVQCQELRWQNDQGKQGYETQTSTQNLLFLNSLPVLTGIDQVLILFHSDHCWQKMQAASSRYLCDNPASGEARFAWEWTAHLCGGICVKQGGNKYPDIC